VPWDAFEWAARFPRDWRIAKKKGSEEAALVLIRSGELSSSGETSEVVIEK